MTNTTTLTADSELKLLYLKTLTALGSGYELARRDMEMRGFGTIFGADQSGTFDVGIG
jgi:transcription-repair coupling factor (superfamily II helicase)